MTATTKFMLLAVGLVLLILLVVAGSERSTFAAIEFIADDNTIRQTETDDAPPIAGGFMLYLPRLASSDSNDIPANGDFELGDVEWNQFSTHHQTLIAPASSIAVGPVSGTWATHLGLLNNETSMISQGIEIPPGRTCLHYSYFVLSSDSCSDDIGGVGVDGVWLHPQYLCAGTATGKWVRRQVSLPMTRTVVLNFAVVNDYSIPSTLYVDAVSLEHESSCPSATSGAAMQPGVVAPGYVGRPIWAKSTD